MINAYLGIDPGSETGAWAVINTSEHIETGTFECFKCFRDSNVISFSNTFCVLESVHCFPGMNSKAMTNFMTNFGGWQATLELLEISYQLIAPQKWQKQILGSFPKGQSKPRALAFARRKWPKLNLKKKDHGIVDALCIALYAKQLYENTKIR